LTRTSLENTLRGRNIPAQRVHRIEQLFHHATEQQHFFVKLVYLAVKSRVAWEIFLWVS
jgi:hypothetical protein